MKKNPLHPIAFFSIFILIACSEAPPLPQVNIDAGGIAIKGYDTVAYFTQGQPVKGSNEFRHEWNSATWQFANGEHLAMFRQNPEKFVPQYGGY